MIKKIALATTLLFTLAQAEIDQKGFFIGLDVSSKNANIDYTTNNINWSTVKDINNFKLDSLSYKLGYQYYFTRVYALISKNKYKDETRNKYNIDVSTYELNVDYIPVLYMNKEKTWNIRGIFGLGLGYNNSKITDSYSTAEDVKSILETNRIQNSAEYGLQVGVMSEFEFGMSIELGYRNRQGKLLEFTDDTNSITFNHNISEYYLGLNYLF